MIYLFWSPERASCKTHHATNNSENAMGFLEKKILSNSHFCTSSKITMVILMANTAPGEAEAASSFRARIVILCWPQQSYWYSTRTRRKSLGANFETQWYSVFCQTKSLAALLIIASGTEANFIAVVAVICNPHFGRIVVIWTQIQAASSASVKTSQGDHHQYLQETAFCLPN